MNSKSKLILGVVGLVAIIAVSTLLYQALSKNYSPQNPLTDITESDPPDGEKTLAPDFSVTDMNGNQVKLSDYIGKPVVVNFWASWCPPCQGEMPEFQKVWNDLGKDVVFMMINATDGTRETEAKAKAFITNEGYTFPVYYDLTLEAAYAYGVPPLPTTLFVDKDGYVITGVKGALDANTLRDGIDLILDNTKK